MGLNYYWFNKKLFPTKKLHIGKSSAGWCFALHVIPEEGIRDLDDWIKIWKKGKIRDEYGRKIKFEEMIQIITQRKAKHLFLNGDGLFRHEIDGEICIAHGEGTWDLIKGDFG